jgi:hypothetical protein
MIGGFVVLAGLAAQGLTVDSDTFDLFPDRPEYCRKGDGSEVDLKAVALLRNETLDLRGYGIPGILTIDGDSMELKATGKPAQTYQQDMAHNALPGERVDVDLSIALYQGRPLLYWKETFKHTAARLGLFAIKNDGWLEPLCVGGPTVVSSH